MANLPTAASLAMDVLRALYSEGSRPGTGTTQLALRFRFGISRPGDDFGRGLAHAAEQGWIEVDRSTDFVKFTAAGFALV